MFRFPSGTLWTSEPVGLGKWTTTVKYPVNGGEQANQAVFGRSPEKTGLWEALRAILQEPVVSLDPGARQRPPLNAGGKRAQG